MPEKESTYIAGGKRRILYHDSPKMSTYLLAFAVGEFDFIQTITEHGVMVRVFTSPGKAKLGQFSLECAKRSLDFFDDFFGIPYPLPKLDMLSVPEFAMVRFNASSSYMIGCNGELVTTVLFFVFFSVILLGIALQSH